MKLFQNFKAFSLKILKNFKIKFFKNIISLLKFQKKFAVNLLSKTQHLMDT